MARLSDDYYHRKCYLEREQVPTQSVMIKKMSAPLANVYFKSMNKKLKVLAGFEPPMKGGGSDWYIPPKEVLGGRVVMHPIKNEYLKELSYEGVGLYGEKLIAEHHKQMAQEKEKTLAQNDTNWKKKIEVTCSMLWEDLSKDAAKANTSAIKHAFHEFQTLYSTSINKIETLLFDAAIDEIQAMKDSTYQKMQAHYESLLKQQATMLYDRYTDKLEKEKAKLKANFIKHVEESRTVMGNQIHDINLEKHIVIEKLRQWLECKNLACQVYVALKEREECEKEMKESQHEQEKKIKVLNEQIALKDFEIRLAKEKEMKRQEFNTIWKKKMCEVVKKFQMFAAYCLHAVPEHADFFIDMEKLMMLQISEAIDNPHAESIFVTDDDTFHTPVARPHPFYLFCDKGYKPQLDQNLCPKHCTSSASQLPVVVINKRYIYAACDNFEMFTDKVTEFIHGRRGNDSDFEDGHIYENDLPVKVTSSQQLTELKLESSLLQVLQQELSNLRNVPTECCVCRIPHCFCSPLHASKMSFNVREEPKRQPSLQSISSGIKIETRSFELYHEREPKWESYMDHVLPRTCKCGKTAKKHLKEHLPAYMRNVSMFAEPELPNYEKCPLAKLQQLVKKAQGKRPPPPPIQKAESKQRNISTQYSDPEFDFLCNCFSDEEITKLFKQLMKGTSSKAQQFSVVGDDVSPVYLSRRPSSFVLECANSLRNLLRVSPQLEEIFKKKDCHY